MADIKNKNELKRRIDLFLDELDYSINEDFCKETMKMMKEFIGHASHRLDCEDSRVKSLKKKLKEYQYLEKQGLLLRLPCKVGDTIYEVSYENREFVIKEHIVNEFIYRTYRFPRIEIYCENENGFLVCNNIGKLDECLFLTQSEAEQKLKEMNTENGVAE